MSAVDPTPYKFWTFLTQSITIQAVNKDGQLGSDVIVTGWFAFSSVTYERASEKEGFEPFLQTDVLTEASAPVTLRLKSEHFGNRPAEEICGRDVTAALKTIFKMPFNDVPKPPQDSKAAIPPSKRGKKKE